MKRSILFHFFIFVSFSLIYGQDYTLNCGEREHFNHKSNTNPSFNQTIKKMEEQLSETLPKNIASSSLRGLAVIPIVFHVIHTNGNENIPDASIIQTFNLLNEAFSNSGNFLSSNGINTNIQFCLARRKPDGSLTNGITRNISSLTNMTIETDDEQLKSINIWQPKDYINVWIVKEISSLSSGNGVVGYSNFANEHGSSTDGIVVEANMMNGTKNNAAVLIHEMGHYFNLYHTFQGGCKNDNCQIDGDRVCDTPPDNAKHSGCNFNSCSTDADDTSLNNPFKNDVNDFTQNYMDYSPLSCYENFTLGQSNRMNLALNLFRQSLLSSKGCQDPCNQSISLNLNLTKTTFLNTELISFPNNSTGVTNYTWKINNSIISQNPNFNQTIAAPGKYELTLIASNNDPNCSIEKTIIIHVNCSANAQFSLSKNTAFINEAITTSNTSTGSIFFGWYIDGTFYSSNKNPAISFLSPGNHTVMLIANTSSCTDTAYQKILVSCNTNLKINSSKNYYKSGESFTISVSGAGPTASYQWSLNGNSISNNNKALTTSFNQIGALDCCVSVTEANCTTVQCISLLISNIDVCDITLFKQYSNNSVEQSKWLIPNPNGGLIVGGGRDEAALMLFIDKDLNITKQKAFDITPVNDIIHGMTIDSDNNLIAIGSLGSGSAETDFIIKYDYTNDKVIWARQLANNSKQSCIFSVIQNPKNKNYVVFGQDYPSANNIDAWMAEFNYLDGSTEWMKFYDMTNQLGDSETFSKAILNNDSYYVVGRNTYGASPGFQGMRFSFSKFDLDGNEVYSKFYFKDVNENARMYLRDIAIDGNTFYTCGFGDFNGIDLQFSSNIFLLSHKENGDLNWAKQYDIQTTNFQRTERIIKTKDAIYLLGFFQKNGNQDVFVMRTDNNGNIVWKKSIDFGGADDIFGAEILNNEIIFTGTSAKGNDTDVILGKISIDGTIVSNCKEINDFGVLTTTLNPKVFSKSYLAYSNTLSNDAVIATEKTPASYNNLGVCESVLTDIAINSIVANCNKDSLINVKICNNGSQVFKELIPISYYDSNPTVNSSKRLKTIFVNVDLGINECKIYTIKAPIINGKNIFIAINDDGKTKLPYDVNKVSLNSISSECLFKNNVDSFTYQNSLIKLDLGNDKFICNSQIMLLKPNTSFVSYLWQDGSTDSIFTAFNPGKYWLKVKDICGNIQSDTINIIQSTQNVDLGNNRTICYGDSVTVSAAGNFDQYYWSSSSQNIINCNNCKSIKQAPLIKTTYYIVASKNGCISNDSVTITPIKLSSNVKDTTVCPKTLLVYYPSKMATNNTWLNLDTLYSLCTQCDSLIMPVTQNWNIVYIGKLGQCEVKDTFSITVKVPNFDLGKDIDICVGDSIKLSATGLSSIVWSSDNQNISCQNCSNITVKPNKKTTYVVNAKSQSCDVSDSIKVNPIKLDLGLRTDTSLCKNDTIPIKAPTGFDNYDWENNNLSLPCSHCNVIKVIGNNAQQVIKLVVRKGLCQAKDEVVVNFEDEKTCIACKEGKVYLPNIFSPNDDGVNDEFYPFSSECEAKVITFKIFDRWGNNVYSAENFPVNNPNYGWKGDFKNTSGYESIYTYYLEILTRENKIVHHSGNVMLIR